VSSLSLGAWYIAPLALNDAPTVAIEKLLFIVKALPRVRIITHMQNYLCAEAVSRLFRFIDDVAFYADEESGLIHMRSASRVGYSDFGVNRKRLEQVRRRYLVACRA
jgi:uncharacterized protein (DUF1499 family)